MASRDPEDITGEPLADYAGSAELLPALVNSPGFAEAEAYFTDYPARTLASPRARAFMYQMVRARRPKLMVEIGTYFAGTSEVIARALWANGGGGTLVTTDPYGGHRVPGIIGGWPRELQDRVMFLDKNSMDFYIEFGAHTPLVDIAFIDGNHAYEFAFYDLISLASWMRPGGIVVLDDCDQPGVFWAAKQFLELNPTWREVGGAFDAFDAVRPFATMSSSVEDVGYLILAAPGAFEITDKPISFTYSQFQQRGIGGFKLKPVANSGAGELHAKVFLRSFHADGVGKPEQLQTSFSTPIEDTEGDRVIPLEPSLLTALDRETTVREAELAFVWHPKDGATPLSLTERPELVVTD